MILERLVQLRQKMQEQNIDVYLVLSSDFHGSEYIGDYFKCREFISGFTGSAGSVVITKTKAGLFTDGRYFLQAEEQLKDSGIKLFRQGEEDVPTIGQFLNDELNDEQCLGFDGRTVNARFIEELQSEFANKYILIRHDVDLIGEIWNNRPAMSREPIWELDIKYAGETRSDKIAKIQQQMMDVGATCHLIASLEDIAWILNLRGNDVQYCPVFLAYAMIDKEHMTLFVHRECMSDELVKILFADQIEIKNYEEIYDFIKAFQAEKIFLDKAKTNYTLIKALDKTDNKEAQESRRVETKKRCKIIDGDNPSTLLKAIKNEVEIANIHQAHIKDGIAMTKLLYWITTQIAAKEKTSDRDKTTALSITEISVADKLEELRQKADDYVGASFASIIGYKEHGAIIHYEATPDSDSSLNPDGLLLMDTGGHYLYGSTDITRTISLGEPTKQQKQYYTAVLKGHINLAMTKFRQGTFGSKLDELAREPIKKLGLDYKHGTGHGVGYLLSVHEGPQAISQKGNSATKVAFVAGMVTSNEPGVYLPREYGIRLENLMLCKRSMENIDDQSLEFETLTMVPFDISLINADDLNQEERQYLNLYHKIVRQNIAPYLGGEQRKWLEEITVKLL